jgi:hypothetical protein
MKFSSYPLDRELLEEQKRGAKENAEQQFANELNDVYTFNGRLRVLSAFDERIPRDPDRQAPRKQSNVSDEMSVDNRDMNGSNHEEPDMVTDLCKAPNQSM